MDSKEICCEAPQQSDFGVGSRDLPRPRTWHGGLGCEPGWLCGPDACRTSAERRESMTRRSSSGRDHLVLSRPCALGRCLWTSAAAMTAGALAAMTLAASGAS